MIKYKFNCINKKGEQEAWSGTFDTEDIAKEWYEIHGVYHEGRGHKLIMVEVDSQDKEEI
jgi:hypothetical protein